MTERRRNLSGFGEADPQPAPPTRKASGSRGAGAAGRAARVPPPRRRSSPEGTDGRAARSPGLRSAAAPPAARPRGDRARGKRRITLSLPVDLAARLRRAAEIRQQYYLDVILSAFAAHHAAVRAQHEESAGAPVSLQPLRRHRPPGRTQVPLNVPAADLAVIDQEADVVGLDRSAYLTEILQRELGSQ